MTTQPTLFELPPAKKRKTRADEIFERFERFHKENPHIWTLFKKFTFEAIQSGRKHYGSMEIIGRIRWHTAVETKGDVFKCCNDNKTYYSRMFEATYPEHGGFFRLRKLSSVKRSATGRNAVFTFDAPENEWEIMSKLRILGGAA